MRGPTARAAFFALALLAAHSSFLSSTTTAAGSSGFGAALELDPMLIVSEGAPEATTTIAATPSTSAAVSGTMSMGVRRRDRWAEECVLLS